MLKIGDCVLTNCKLSSVLRKTRSGPIDLQGNYYNQDEGKELEPGLYSQTGGAIFHIRWRRICEAVLQVPPDHLGAKHCHRSMLFAEMAQSDDGVHLRRKTKKFLQNNCCARSSKQKSAVARHNLETCGIELFLRRVCGFVSCFSTNNR